MKKLIVLVISLFLIGCATVGLDKKVADLEEKVAKIEMMGLAGSAAANFYPARDFTGSAAGDLDNIAGTVDKDVGFVVTEDGTYGNSAFIYVLDANSNCGSIDTDSTPPKYFPSDDGGTECWELASVYSFRSVGAMKQVAHSGGNDTLTVEEVTNTFLYVTVAAEFELPEIGTDAQVYIDTSVEGVALGSSFCVFTVGAIAITLDPHVNNSIFINGTEETNGDYIVNTSAAGDFICLVACEDNGWCAPTNPSAWTAE